VRHTDRSYVPTDYQLQSEIEAAVRDQSISAWEQMLSARTLGGRMGAEVLARRPRFRGGHARREIRAYARMLAGAGLTLGVCDWGYCVYREEVSACRGSVSAPDPVRREPSKRLNRTPCASRIRRQTAEHPFGTLKAWMGATHFRTRTLPRVSTEMSLHVLAYNMKRAMQILGIVPLMAAIRA
jgi:hypothetical protein